MPFKLVNLIPDLSTKDISSAVATFVSGLGVVEISSFELELGHLKITEGAAGYNPSELLQYVSSSLECLDEQEVKLILLVENPIAGGNRSYEIDGNLILCLKGVWRSRRKLSVAIQLLYLYLRWPNRERLTCQNDFDMCLVAAKQHLEAPKRICEECTETLESNGISVNVGLDRINALNPKLDNGEHVILVHGIRTEAIWAENLRTLLEEAGYSVSVFRYGYISTLMLSLNFLTTNGLTGALFQHYLAVRADKPTHKISVIAHSNGTLILGRLLRKHRQAYFSSVILAGSILPRAFKWSRLKKQGQVRAVLNDCGGDDIWPIVASRFIVGAGSSGTLLFNSDEIDQVIRPDLPHSGMLNEGHARKYWIPFLASGEVVKDLPDEISDRVRRWRRGLFLKAI